MTARSRRHKFDKKRKSDEHPHPRRSEEADGSTESTRSRTGLIPRKREGEGEDAEHKGIIEAILEAKQRYRLHSVYLVPEGQGFPGSYIKKGAFPTEDLVELNVIEPTEYSILRGYPQGAKLYLNDYEKELLNTLQREFEEKLAGGQEAVRTAGSSDDEASA